MMMIMIMPNDGVLGGLDLFVSDMLRQIGVKSIDELIETAVPDSIIDTSPLELPSSRSESNTGGCGLPSASRGTPSYTSQRFSKESSG